jgi:hypothetical protein
MTALITLLVLAHFHLIGFVIVLFIGAILAALALSLIGWVLGILGIILASPFLLIGWIGDKIMFTKRPDAEWKHKVDHWVSIGLLAFFPLLFGGIYATRLLGH